MAKILVVDDDETTVAMLVRMLESAGYKAVPCSSGEVGLAIIDHEAFDIVLTDVDMPHMSGIELTLQIRAMLPGLPIIAMSGSSMATPEASLQLCARYGASAVLSKPFRAAELFSALEALGISRPSTTIAP
jgi:CheY-like chemotaxis protein